MLLIITDGFEPAEIKLVQDNLDSPSRLTTLEEMNLAELDNHGKFRVFLSPKQLKGIGLPTTVAMAGKPVPGGWCLPDVRDVINKGVRIPAFEKSLIRIKHAKDRKQVPVQILYTLKEVITVLQSIAKYQFEYAIDLETSCLDPTTHGAKILTMAMSTTAGDWSWPWAHKDGSFTIKDRNQIVEALRSVFAICPGNFHNAKYEIKWLKHLYNLWPILQSDSMLFAYLLDERRSTALSELIWDYYPEYAGYEGFTSGVDHYEDIGLEELCQYNATDTHFTLRLCRRFEPLLVEADVAVWDEVLQLVTPDLAVMELNGWHLDLLTYKSVAQWYENKKDELTRALMQEPEVKLLIKLLKNEGKTLNLAYEQKKRLLFDIAKIKPNKRLKTKGGGLSTDSDAMEWYADNNSDAAWLQDLRLISKVTGIQNNFLKDRGELIKQHTDSRIHTNYNTHLVVTGRLSSTDPNQQNLPRDSDLAVVELESIKQMYSSRFGKQGLILSADYSQIEMRVTTALAQDPGFMQAYKNKEDVHAQTAELLFGPGWGKPERSKAKTVNFSILNDISAYELSTDIDESEDKAQDFIDQFFDAHPAIRKLMNSYHHTVLEQGYVETPLGRKRRFHKELMAPHTTTSMIKHICRQAANFPIQSLASDITLRTIAFLGNGLRDSGMDSVLMGTVHDSIVMDCVIDEIESLADYLKNVVANFELFTGWTWLEKVPLEIDISIGENLSKQYNVAE